MVLEPTAHTGTQKAYVMGMRIFGTDRKFVSNSPSSDGSVAGTGQQKPVLDQRTHFFGLINTAARTSKRTAASTSTPQTTADPDRRTPTTKSNVARPD